jgi:hypothetical protein
MAGIAGIAGTAATSLAGAGAAADLETALEGELAFWAGTDAATLAAAG